ncbi:MAG TPA: class I SAM-dependent methyltransferase [Terriglobales bacterium]|nr:class I SAM-dependent methyltransferase [Terriglobales bacterium]
MPRPSSSTQLRELFPSQAAFRAVCRRGLSEVRPLTSAAIQNDQHGWNYGSTTAPSYWAYGRLRALFTLNVATSFGAKRVLEIAAGDGALSACLQRSGCEVTVNDIRSDAIRAAIASFANAEQIKIASGNVFDLDTAQIGSFDLVIACELIEHVADSVALLRKLKTFLSPNGRILITTPNGAYFRNHLPTYDQVVDRDSLVPLQFQPDADGHLFLITPEEMERVASNAELHVESCEIWGTPFISGESGLRFLRGLLPPSLCLRLEELCGRLPYSLLRRSGNSLMCVLR